MLTQDVIPLSALYLAVLALLMAGSALALSGPPRSLLMPDPGDEREGGPDGDAGEQGPSGWKTAAQAAGAVVLVTALFGLVVWAATLKGGLRYLFGAVAVVAALQLAATLGRSAPARARHGRPNRSSLYGTAASAVLLLAVVAAWLLWPGWLTLSLVTAIWILMVISTAQIASPFGTAAVAATAVAFGFDFVQVFATGSMVHVANAAVSGQVPILIEVPAHLALTSPYTFALGQSDVAIPGVLVVIAGRMGQRAGKPALYWAAVGGYGVGLAAALAAAAAWNIDLPAMVFVIPGVVTGVLVAARRCGAWGELRRRQFQSPPLREVLAVALRG